MYYVERNPITAAMFLTGGVAEPAPGETEWVGGGALIPKGTERIRSTLHRVFRAAVDIPVGDLTAPENDPTRWQDMRATERYLPLGPILRADKQLVYESNALERTTGDIELRMLQRYANAVAIFGMLGAVWEVDVFNKPEAEGGVLVVHKAGRIKRGARGYWDYGHGQRYTLDRVLVHGLPIYPRAEIRVRVKGSGTQMRRMSQCEIGKLRYLPGILPGGVEYGLVRDPKIFTARKQEPNGSTSVLIYGNGYDMRGTVDLAAEQEDSVLFQFRNLLGKGVAYTPSLDGGWDQSLVFGTLKSAPTSRENFQQSKGNFEIEGLPA